MFKKPNTYSNLLSSLNYSFFRSRRQVVAAVVGGTVCVGSLVTLPNFALDWTKAVLEIEREGTTVAPTSRIRRLVEEAKADLQWSQSQKSIVKLYCTESDLVEAYGTIKKLSGAIIGIPVYLNAEKPEDVEVEPDLITLTQEEKNKELDKFRQNSLLSDSAKLYVIREGLAQVEGVEHFVTPTLLTSGTFLTSCLLPFLHHRLHKVKIRPLFQRLYVFVVSVMLCTSVCFVLWDFTAMNRFENFVRSLNDKYVHSGIEYYEKLILRTESRRNLVNAPLLSILDEMYFDYICSRRLNVLKAKHYNEIKE